MIAEGVSGNLKPKMRNKTYIIIPILTLMSCGTGPWFMNRKIYRTYKQDIYTSTSNTVKTNGYYIQIGELHPRASYRDAIIFYENGYTLGFWLEEKKLQSDIKTKITHRKDTLLAELDRWKVNKDSLIIEHYAETKRDMITWNYYERGKILNDSMIELRYDNSPYKPVKFKFIQTDSLPIVINNARYLKKDWYFEELNMN